MDYGGKRAEAGDIVDDLPSGSVKWLLEQGHIAPADAAPESTETTPDAEAVA
jgi:hypothetical protein